MAKPTIKELVELAGISKTYASVILSGAQDPSRPLAIFIFRKTGWRHKLIAKMTEDQMRAFEEVDPWAPAQSEAA